MLILARNVLFFFLLPFLLQRPRGYTASSALAGWKLLFKSGKDRGVCRCEKVRNFSDNRRDSRH